MLDLTMKETDRRPNRRKGTKMNYEVDFDGDFGTINYENGEEYGFYIENGEVVFADDESDVFALEETRADIAEWPAVADLLHDCEVESRLFARDPYAYYGVREKDFY